MLKRTPVLHSFKEPLLPARFFKLGKWVSVKQPSGEEETFQVIRLRIDIDLPYEDPFYHYAYRWFPMSKLYEIADGQPERVTGFRLAEANEYKVDKALLELEQALITHNRSTDSRFFL